MLDTLQDSMHAGEAEQQRTLGPGGALTLNLLDMIGAGPFITLPLLVAAMGGPQAMLGWLLGALLAVCDGLVWAELGAAMPEAGGTYAYLRRIFPGSAGRWLSFLFVFQLCLTAPLSVASGCIGLAGYAGALFPKLNGTVPVHTVQWAGYRFGIAVGWPTALAAGTVVLAVILLYRQLLHVERWGRSLLLLVLFAIAWTFLTALWRGDWHRVLVVSPGAWRPSPAFFSGLGSAMLVATYDFWGYYNVTFLGGEVRDPGRTIPRALLLSIGIVTGLYLLLNASSIALLGSPKVIGLANVAGGKGTALLSAALEPVYAAALGPAAGALVGKLAALLVMVAAFASVFSLLLGYSRIPFAAARDGNFFHSFSRLHPKLGIPDVSLLSLAAVSCLCCCFSLRDVVSALVVLRIVLQFGLQQVGVMLLRRREPELPRPFRVWLYPLPPLLALCGFGFLVVSRVGWQHQVLFSLAVAVAGSLAYLLWSWLGQQHGGRVSQKLFP